ncbi:flagellar hook-associated protein FlgL [Thiomicrorhabdus sp. 6S2-11]|uniref:Flagellar hook-associated protein FlgL n=1 Tax=Thiomicrorhabdus marina TaxID=2818442 RepID=A0ABS3Q819_9GAMM|nr:flagellar hook-associated protein FlgL [Thiomicrorhabdus marina]MBO1928456.1 flagellar hook-associated protein FlgL [Thiomicrorhabdus marina]
MRISTNQFHSQGLASIQKHQEDILQTQLQLSTGKRVNAPGDDPVALSQINALNRTMDTIDQYAKNGDFAKSQLVQEETAITDVISAVQRARELTIQMMNDTYNEGDRKATAAEIGELIEHVSNLMNYSTSEGEKLFAGSNVNVEQAFVSDQVNPGYVSYIGNENAGDDYDPLANYGSRFVQISFDSDNTLNPNDYGDSSRVRITDNGARVFGIPDPVSTLKSALPFVEEINNDGALEQANLKFYPMTEGQSITVAGLTYTADTSLSAKEVALAFENLADGATTGGAATGTYTGTLTGWQSGALVDNENLVFETTTGAIGEDVADISVTSDDVNPPEHNILNVLYELKRDLENNDTSGMGLLVQDMDASVEQLTQVRAEIGGRQNRIESQYDSGETFKLSLEERRMNLEELDIVQGITDLTQQQNALQMAQQVFTRVNEMSLFNYLR